LSGFHFSCQKVEETGPVEDLAHPGAGVGNPQPAVYGCGQVECPHQLADSGGVDSGDLREIKHDHAFSLPKQQANVVAERSTDGHTKRAFDANNAGIRSIELENYAQFASSILSAFTGFHRRLEVRRTSTKKGDCAARRTSSCRCAGFGIDNTSEVMAMSRVLARGAA
jgi:hypothetical protein